MRLPRQLIGVGSEREFGSFPGQAVVGQDVRNLDLQRGPGMGRRVSWNEVDKKVRLTEDFRSIRQQSKM